MPRKFCHLVAIRMVMNKIAEADKYLDYRDKTLERTVKSWRVLLRTFLDETADFELTAGTVVQGSRAHTDYWTLMTTRECEEHASKCIRHAVVM